MRSPARAASEALALKKYRPTFRHRPIQNCPPIDICLDIDQVGAVRSHSVQEGAHRIVVFSPFRPPSGELRDMSSRPSRSTLDIAEKLIGFDTVSRNSNLELIEWVREYLTASDVNSTLIFDESGKKANLFATIGPAGVPGIVLSGHTDVVPVDGQDWSSDPFVLEERDGRLFGRGACDMKSFIAAVLAAVPAFARADLHTPIHLAFSYDEEVGCRGVPSLLAFMRENDVAPRLCIIGEPTEMKVIIAHKGNKRYRCVVHGLECHSALADQGVNAVEAAAEMVARLKSMARNKTLKGPFDGAFSPPYTTAVHTGLIHGGTAMNIVPNHCPIPSSRFAISPATIGILAQGSRGVRFQRARARDEGREQGCRNTILLKSQLPGLSTDQQSDAATLSGRSARSRRRGRSALVPKGAFINRQGSPALSAAWLHRAGPQTGRMDRPGAVGCLRAALPSSPATLRRAELIQIRPSRKIHTSLCTPP